MRLLEHDDPVWRRTFDQRAVDAHLAGARRGQAGHDVQQRRLAAAGAADQRNRLAGLHLETDVAQRIVRQRR